MKRLLVAVFLMLPVAAAADPLTPAARAKASIDAQIATFKLGLAGQAKFLAMFDPKGVIVGDGGVMTPAELAAALAEPYEGGSNESYGVHAMLAQVFGANVDGSIDRGIKKVTLGKVTAGGVADAVWVSFDLTERAWITTRFRISELLVDRGGWKIVAAHIGVPQPDSWEDEEESEGGGPTPWGAFPDHGDDDLGPIASLAVSPPALAKAIAKEPVILGTTSADVAIGGAAAGKLLRSWAKLKLEESDYLEVHAATWGYAVVQVKLPGKPGHSMKMRATVFAIPKPDKTWQVVVAQYSRVRW